MRVDIFNKLILKYIHNYNINNIYIYIYLINNVYIKLCVYLLSFINIKCNPFAVVIYIYMYISHL